MMVKNITTVFVSMDRVSGKTEYDSERSAMLAQISSTECDSRVDGFSWSIK